MIAFASRTPRETKPFLSHLARFSREGMLVERWTRHPGGNHPDGWGAAWRAGGRTNLVRGALPAWEDPRLAEAEAGTCRFVGHVRFASNRASVSAENAHPFLLGDVALAHNGTFYGEIGDEGDERGVSDSFVFLERLARRWGSGGIDELAALLGEILADREVVGEYTAANLLILRGDDLFAFRHSRKDEGYYSLYLREEEGGAVVASEPLDGDGWIPLRDGELVEISAPALPREMLYLP
jgi:predicted glutamine amidotransferase